MIFANLSITYIQEKLKEYLFLVFILRSDTKAGEDCESEDLKSRDNSGNSML